jgi:hypothetical protein
MLPWKNVVWKWEVYTYLICLTFYYMHFISGLF